MLKLNDLWFPVVGKYRKLSEYLCCVHSYSGIGSHTNHGGVTHIITSMQLSASKTQKYKSTKSRTLTHVVTPDWIKESYGPSYCPIIYLVNILIYTYRATETSSRMEIQCY